MTLSGYGLCFPYLYTMHSEEYLTTMGDEAEGGGITTLSGNHSVFIEQEHSHH